MFMLLVIELKLLTFGFKRTGIKHYFDPSLIPFYFLLQFDMKPTPNQLLLQQQHFQQQMANEADNASNSSSLVTTRHGGHADNRSTGGPGSSESVSAPQTPNPSSPTSASNLPPLHLKLQDQHGQYPFAAVAAALHNQIPAAHNSRWVSCVLDVV